MSIPAVEIKLLGVPSVTRAGLNLTPSVRKSLALLAYLALEGPTHRDRLADLLWSDMEQKDARRNLRQELWRLQRSPLAELFEVKPDSVGLTAGLQTDVHHFQRHLELAQVGAALERYGGPLLVHLELAGAVPFEDWLEVRRGELGALCQDALQRHAALLEAQGDLRGALGAHLRLLEDDEFQEVYQREAMRLHLKLGERGAALLRFERYERLLERELGLRPLPETEALARSLRNPTLAQVEAQPHSSPTLGWGAGMQGAPGLSLPLVGRGAQWATLSESTVALTLLTGESGVGKTRLSETFAATFGVQVHLRFYEVSLETPLYCAAEALRTALADPRGRERLEQLEPMWRMEAARLVPELEETGPSPAHPEGRARFLAGVACALMCAAGPGGVLVFDDLHWADPLSLELLLHLAREQRQGGPRLLATARTQELLEHTALGTALVALEREGRLRRVLLSPLSAPEVLSLVQMLSGHPAQRFATRLFEASSGNPLYLLETLRHLFESGTLRQDAHGEWSTSYDASTEDYAELPLPSSVRDAILRRINHHGPTARRLLEAACLLDKDFSLEDLVPALSLSDWEALEALEGLLGVGLLVRLQGDGYGFSHALVRRVTLEELGPERRRLIHRRLAERLEKTSAPAGRVAHHLEQAGQSAQAAKWRIRAAQDAAKVYAHFEALEHYEKALEDGLTLHEAFAVRAAREQVFKFLGEVSAREAECSQMQRLAHEADAADLKRAAQLSRVNLDLDAGRFPTALEGVERFLTQTDLPPVQRAEGLNLAGFVLGKLGRAREGETLLRQALECSGELPEALLGSVHNNLSNLALDRGDLVGAGEHNRLALRSFSAVGNLRAWAIALNSSARMAHLAGDAPQALLHLHEALGVSQKLGDRHLQVMFLNNVVRMQVDLGHLDKALEALNSGMAVIREPRSPVHEGVLRSRAADVYRLQGELGVAFESDRVAIGLADDLGALNVQMTRRVHHAHFLLQLGDWAAAGRLLREASEQVTDVSAPHLTLEVGWAELEWARGEMGLALARLDGALEGEKQGEPWLYGQVLRASARVALDPLTERVEEELPQHPALRASALRVRLHMGTPGAATPLHSSDLLMRDLEEARSLLDSGRVPPLETLELQLALSHAWTVLGSENARTVSALRQTARALQLRLSASLPPELRKAFDEKFSLWPKRPVVSAGSLE